MKNSSPQNNASSCSDFKLGQPETVRTIWHRIRRLACHSLAVNARSVLTVTPVSRSESYPRHTLCEQGFVKLGSSRINNLRRSPKVESYPWNPFRPFQSPNANKRGLARMAWNEHDTTSRFLTPARSARGLSWPSFSA